MKKLPALIVAFFFCAAGFAQQQYTFTAYTQEQGLPSGNIRNIYKDTTGYIWLMSEEGVTRFDGYRFKVFRYDPDDSSSLPKNETWAGAFPALGDIYFYSVNRHSLFNSATEKFTTNLPFGDNFSIEEAKGNRNCYWVMSKSAIFRISKTGRECFALPFAIETNSWQIRSGPDDRVMLFSQQSRTDILYFDYRDKRVSKIKITDHWGREQKDVAAAVDIVCAGNNFYLFTSSTVYRFNTAVRSFEWQRDLKSSGNFNYDYGFYLAYNDSLIMIRSKTGFLNIFNLRTGAEKLVYVNKIIPEKQLNDRSIFTCIPDHNGGVWLATTEMGLIHYMVFTGEMQQYIHEDGNSNCLPGNFIQGIFPDNNGIIWISCFGHGLIKMEPAAALFKTAVPLTVKVSSSSTQGWRANIRCFLEAGDGYWVATMNGLFASSSATDKFSDIQNIYILPNSNSHNNSRNIVQSYPVGSLAEDQSGNAWIGTWFGDLIIYNKKLTRSFLIPEPLQKREGTGIHRNLFCDKRNRMWISTYGGGIRVIDCNALNFEKINETKDKYDFFVSKDSCSLSSGFVFVVTEDAEGNIWAGTDNGLCRYNEQSGKWKRYYNIPGNENSIHNNNVRSMCLDRQGNLWIGTNGGGLNRYNKEQDNFTHFTTENGLVNDQVYSLVCDNNGMLWMGTNSGLCRFNPRDYACKNFTEKDGIQNYEYNTNAAVKLKDGTLLIGGVSGYNIIKPDKIENKKSTPPVVVISSFKVFEKEMPLGNNSIMLNYKENNLTFEFSALSYFRNQENRYAYKLEGVDRDWIFIDTRRFVSYSKLEPGNYIFRVKACNSDGVWNETGAQLQITIHPPWWKTNWARIIFILVVVGSIIGYFRYRTNALRRRQKELETEVEKATVTIRKQKEVVEAEKKRSDELLLNILPPEVAEELKEKGYADARQFDIVTVLFTDFKDFTAYSEKMSPQDLVKDIDECFKGFDRITSKYGIEKIKTIGDSYMCAGGLPVEKTTNPEDTVKAALEMRDFILSGKQKKIAEGKAFFEIRIGLHTGPVVAGIVGVKKFAYDIWGDTVNIASRMESSGEPGKVNISSTTYELVKDKFSCTYRGKIQAKNKGEIEMYFVESIL